MGPSFEPMVVQQVPAQAVAQARPNRLQRALRLISWPLVQALILLVRAYQLLIAPALRPSCRFEPSCSRYAVETLSKDGLVKGLAKTTWRLCRCHPLGKGGYDPP